MIEVQVPKDVTGYESTLIGPLTARQTVCVAIAAAVEYVYYIIVSNSGLGLDMNSMVGIGTLLAIPILYLAIGKPYGMRPETYIYYYLLPSLFANKDRPYETKISYDVILEEIEKKEQEKLQKSGTIKADKKNKKKKSQKKARSKQDILYA